MRPLPTGTLILLFSDIEGSTLALNRLGKQWPEALSAQRAILRSCFEAHDGVEMGTEGDSFRAVSLDEVNYAFALLRTEGPVRAYDHLTGIAPRA